MITQTGKTRRDMETWRSTKTLPVYDVMPWGLRSYRIMGAWYPIKRIQDMASSQENYRYKMSCHEDYGHLTSNRGCINFFSLKKITKRRNCPQVPKRSHKFVFPVKSGGLWTLRWLQGHDVLPGVLWICYVFPKFLRLDDNLLSWVQEHDVMPRPQSCHKFITCPQSSLMKPFQSLFSKLNHVQLGVI